VTSFAKLAAWVEDKPLVIARFDQELSDALHESRQGFEHLTIVRPHAVFRDVKVPTLCIIEVAEIDGPRCYLGAVTRRKPVSTFDTRLTIKKLCSISPSSLAALPDQLGQKRQKKLLTQRIPESTGFAMLSSKLSSAIIDLLAQDNANHLALQQALTLMPNLRKLSPEAWAQKDAISLALNVFGIRSGVSPKSIALKTGASSGVSLLGAYLYEDNVVHNDATSLPGFERVAQDATGRAVFEKGDERLVIYTANKLPLEILLGVDLIYVNETRGNIVMIQYKMLKEEEGKDWIFRPDKQFKAEIGRMKIPPAEGMKNDYRLHPRPFFFKFVKRKVIDDSPQSFLLSLDHVIQVLASSRSTGKKGGIRMSYQGLDGTYLREADMIGLIRSGYIGTHRVQSDALSVLIDEAARGNRALVLAWQAAIS
jgi:hypothetical protein